MKKKKKPTQKPPSLPEALFILREAGHLGLPLAEAILVIYRSLHAKAERQKSQKEER